MSAVIRLIPTRPALRYHGGKWRLAPSIIPHFPPHRTYVEPFGGAASILAHGSSGMRGHRTGFRIGSGRKGSTPAGDWRGFPDAIPAIVERLQGVFLERRPAAKILRKFDRADTLFYLDPPYPFDTRSQKRIGNDLYHGYRHELTDAGHAELLAQITTLVGMVVLSTYPNPAYDAALAGWARIEISAQADRGEARTEVLFLNPAASRTGPLQLDIETYESPDARHRERRSA